MKKDCQRIHRPYQWLLFRTPFPIDMPEKLNTLVIDMTAEKGKRFVINGEPIDTSNVLCMDIHIEGGRASIMTYKKRNMVLGD